MEIRSSEETPSKTNRLTPFVAETGAMACGGRPNARTPATAGTAPAISFMAWRRFNLMVSGLISDFGFQDRAAAVSHSLSAESQSLSERYAEKKPALSGSLEL
jgi:hypothetical protein